MYESSISTVAYVLISCQDGTGTSICLGVMLKNNETGLCVVLYLCFAFVLHGHVMG